MIYIQVKENIIFIKTWPIIMTILLIKQLWALL
ncbi:hypothetical protein M948_01925 [Virgibacillus sp. CM-4]|nr:hypothetical protein M948_01925 [Virgibacillus sp. CM-4]